MPCEGEIEDGQLPVGEREPRPFVRPHAGVIRAAVDEGVRHALRCGAGSVPWRALQRPKAGQAAHVIGAFAGLRDKLAAD